MKYEIVLGLEIHMQLNTAMKMFCSCKNNPFYGNVNEHVCPICLGLPGAMPVPNKEAIEKAQQMASALRSNLRDEIIFERKNYFYPDLPKGFQITTPHYPVSEKGSYEMLFPRNKRHPELDSGSIKSNRFRTKTGYRLAHVKSRMTSNNDTIYWREIHLEEDTAKSIHKDGKTWIDFNKSGVPLLEMVTEPDFHSIEKAVQFAKEIQWYARYLGVSNANMEKGQMRLEANISLRKIKSQKSNVKTTNQKSKLIKNLPDYRVELKNINSFTFMKKALEAEIKRQSNALENGETLVQETRGFDETKKKTFSQREKEEAHDYRYFPEPDILPVSIKYQVSSIKYQTPKQSIDKLRKLNVRESYLPIIVGDKKLAEFTLGAITLGEKEGIKTDTIAGEIVNKKINPEKIKPQGLIESIKQSKSSIITDESEIEKWVKQAIKENPDAVYAIRKGKIQAIGALVGSVMKQSKGTAGAKKARQIIQKVLK